MLDSKFTKLKLSDLTNGVRLPQVNISDKLKLDLGLDLNCSNYDVLVALVKKGFFSKKDTFSKAPEVYKERCKQELRIFKQLNLVDYVLLIHDFLDFVSSQGISRGKGRGSVTGSLVMYLIGVTQVDPIKHNLPFARFISEARAQSKEIDGIIYLNGATMPDVDTDISYKRRSEVISYITNKYPNRTAKISNNLTLTGKALIKDVVKVILNYHESDAKRLSDMIDKRFGTVERLSDTYKNSALFKKWVDESAYNKYSFNIARKLEKLVISKGQHASGMAISYNPIDELVPLERSVSGEDIVTAFDMKDVANILVKIDILGLKTADLIQDTIQLIGNIKEEDIDINDPSIYGYLASCSDYHGLFQIEKGLGKNTVLQVQPKNIDQLCACLAIGRPGAMKFIPDFIKFVKTGEMPKVYPAIDEILGETGGILIYQEQINRICQEVYKISADDAELIRRAIGKKKREEMEVWEPVLYKQGELLNIPKEVTDYFWNVCNDSADYLFSVNHSMAYAYITALTVYLKANYPKQFFLALLRIAKEEDTSLEQISIISKEMINLGIKLLPPSIARSEVDFYIDEEANAIRYGLGAIKNIGEAVREKLMNFNRNNPTKFHLFNNCLNSKLGLRSIQPLIMAGCFPDYGVSRSKLLLEYQTFNILTDRERNLVFSLGEKFNYNLFDILRYLSENKDADGKDYIKPSRLETIKRDYYNYKEIYKFNSEHEDLSIYLLEKYSLGFAYSKNLTALYQSKYSDIIGIKDLEDLEDKSYVTIVGTVLEVEQKKSQKNNTPFVKFILEDDYNSIGVIAYGEDRVKQLMDADGKLIKDGIIIIIRGQKSGDIIFANKLYPQWKAVAVKQFTEIAKINKHNETEEIK